MLKSLWLRVLLISMIPVVVGAIAYFNVTQDTQTDILQSPEEATEEQVLAFCAACHTNPPPDSFPREAWKDHVDNGYIFLRGSGLKIDPPPATKFYAYYDKRAPNKLGLPNRPVAQGKSPVSWKYHGHPIPGRQPQPILTNVNLVRFRPTDKLKVLACECDPLTNEGKIHQFDPESSEWKVLANVPSAVSTQVVDLNGDGIQDILVACLGTFFPNDSRQGRIVWLRGKADGSFESVTLLKNIGRVAEVQAADFTGDGKLDLVVAEFGWRKIGSVLMLENRTTDWAMPQFETHVIDKRTGALNVPVADINGDGKPDFVALFGQEHETVVAFINEGGGRFRSEVIYQAPHPAYGSSGIRLADIDGDKDLDVVYTNGDNLGSPFLLKPYQGIHLLENRGGYPFAARRLADMPGVQRAVVGDVDGDGDQDIVAVSYLPAEEFPRDLLDLDSVLLLEQTSKGNFVRRPLETKTCDHFSCALGDVQGNGRLSLVLGNFYSSSDIPIRDWLSIWSEP